MAAALERVGGLTHLDLGGTWLVVVVAAVLRCWA